MWSGKAAEAEIFSGQAEMVGDAVGDGLRGQRVDQVPDAVRQKDDPGGTRNANRVLRGKRAAQAPGGKNGGGAESEEDAPVSQVEREKQEDQDALRGGPDGEQDLRRRGTPAHEESAERVGGSEGEGGAEKGGKQVHRAVPLQQHGVDLMLFVGRRSAGSGDGDGAEEFEQRGFGAIEETVDQFAEGDAAHGVAGGLR